MSQLGPEGWLLSDDGTKRIGWKNKDGTEFLFQFDGSNNVAGITGPGGVVTPLPGSSLTSGSWYQSPGIFKLILSGVGTVAVSAKNSAGVETLVDTITVNSAYGESAYPYLGDTAVQIKVDLTGTAIARLY